MGHLPQSYQGDQSHKNAERYGRSGFGSKCHCGQIVAMLVMVADRVTLGAW